MAHVAAAVFGLVGAFTSVAQARGQQSAPGPAVPRMVVVDADGKGVVAADVRVLRQSQTDGSPMAALLVDTESGANGLARAPVPQIPGLLVVVDHPRHLPFIASYPGSLPPSTVQLEAGLVVSGEVEDGETREDVWNARVCASWTDENAPERFRRWQRCVATDEAGRFEIAGLRSDGVSLTVAAHGFKDAEWRLDEAAPLARFALERASDRVGEGPADAATGRVVVEVVGWDGEPVKSFTMRVETASADRRSGTSVTVDQSTIPAEAEIPAEYLSAGIVAVTFEAENHLRSPMTGLQLTAGGEVDLGAIFLEPGAVVQGRIFDSAGSAPLAGCLVEVLVSGAGEIRAHLMGMRPMTVSDQFGSYMLGGLSEGRYRLRMHCHGAPTVDRLVVLEDSEHLDLGETWLDPGSRVMVRVDGVTEGRLRVLDRFRDVSTPISETVLTAVARREHRTVGDEGSVAAELVLAPGDYRFEVLDAGGALRVSQEARVVEGRSGSQGIRLKAATRTIRSVLTMGGRPVAGGTVLLGPVLNADRATGTIVINSQAGSAAPRSRVFRAGEPSRRADVEADGSFVVEGAPEDLLWMTWYRPDGATMSRLWPEEALSQLDLGGTRVNGIFLDRDGRPIDRGAVGLIGDLGREVATATSLEDGRFELPPSPPGRYLLRGQSANPGIAVVEVDLAGEALPPLVLRVPDFDTGGLQLTLRRPGGRPAAGSWIHIVDAAGDTAGTGLSSGRGRFGRGSVPAGDVTLLWSDGAACVGGTTVTVEPGEAADLTFELPTGRLIELRCPVEDCAGSSLSFLSVKTASGVEVAGHLSGAPGGTLFSDAGTLGLGCVTPDAYELSFWAAGRRWTAEARVSSVGATEVPIIVRGRPAGL